MKNVLLACDFSNNARDAYKVAVQIAAAFDGKVFIVNMIAIPIIQKTPFGLQVARLDDRVVLKLKKNANHIFDHFKSRHYTPENVRLKFLPLYFELLMDVQAFVNKHKIDVVVLGTNRSNQLDEILLGPTEQDSISALTVPVLAVKSRSQLASIKNILFPYIMHQSKFIAQTKVLQCIFSAILHVVLVNEGSNGTGSCQLSATIQEFVQLNELKDYTINVVNNMNFKSGILNFMNQNSSDILIMATDGQQGLVQLFTDILYPSSSQPIDR